MRDDLPTATSTRTAPAVRSPARPTPETQAKRRSLFIGLLGTILLPAVVVSLLPNAQAKETVVASAPDESSPLVESPTTATQAPTTATTVATSTSAGPKPSTTSTARRKPSTTTTTKPKPTTTTAPEPAPRAAAAPVTAAPSPSGPGATPAEAAFLACIRQRESGGNYSVVSSNGLWFGAYQMTRQTWDATAPRAGRPDLVGVPPNQASPGDQDHLALVLYRWLGKGPWGGAC